MVPNGAGLASLLVRIDLSPHLQRASSCKQPPLLLCLSCARGERDKRTTAAADVCLVESRGVTLALARGDLGATKHRSAQTGLENGRDDGELPWRMAAHRAASTCWREKNQRNF